MKEIILIKTNFQTFKPAYESDLEIAKNIPSGEAIKVKYSKPRNYQFHKKYFALIKLIFENQNLFTDIENMRKEIIKYAGFYDEYTTLKGETEYRAKSISFGSMDDITFSELYKKSLQVIFKHILKLEFSNENINNIEEELINFM